MSDPTQHLGLLLLDLQAPFLNAIPNSDRLLNRCCFAAQAAQLLGLSTALTEQSPQKLGTTHSELIKCLPETTPVFDKNGFSAFEAEGLHRWIEANQIEHILLAGLESTICIYQTALNALSDDIGVTLLADCIGERRIEDREPVFQQLLSMDAHILPSETIFYSLIGSADHPAFKAFTKMVKRYN